MSTSALQIAAGPGLDPESNAVVAHYARAYAAAAPTLPGGDSGWLRALRELGIRRFSEMGFPDVGDEQWKYTRVAAIARRRFKPGRLADTGVSQEDLAPFLLHGVECHRLVFVDGWHSPELSSPGALPSGAAVDSLARVLTETRDLVEPWVRQADFRSGFEALNTAFLGDGAWIHLEPGVVLERPIHVIYAATGAGEPRLCNVRTLIVSGPNSQAKVIESYVSLGAEHLTLAVTTIALAEGASLEHYKLQEESDRAFHVGRMDVREGRASRFTSHAVALGAELCRNDIVASLEAEGAECTLNGLYMVEGRQHVDFHTTVEHREPHGTSREYYKGILGGRSRGVFNGRVHVHPGAQRTDSDQSNKNLLLSRDAEVDTKPELEIYADDVKCSHGATVGQLDPDMLFYLRARGIDEAAARGLLTYGFAQDIIERMGIAAVRARIEEVILTRVPDAEHVKAMV